MTASAIIRKLRLMEAKLNYDIACLPEGTDIPADWWGTYHAEEMKLFEELGEEELTTAEEIISTLRLLENRLDEGHPGNTEVREIDTMLIGMVIGAVSRAFPSRLPAPKLVREAAA